MDDPNHDAALQVLPDSARGIEAVGAVEEPAPRKECEARGVTFEEITEVVELCNHPGYVFMVERDGRGEMFLQADYVEPDVVTGILERQLTRRWFLSPEMTRSEVVQTAFKCIMTSMEHRAREWFTYREQAVFGPHFNVESLVEICLEGKLSNREPK